MCSVAVEITTLLCFGPSSCASTGLGIRFWRVVSSLVMQEDCESCQDVWQVVWHRRSEAC